MVYHQRLSPKTGLTSRCLGVFSHQSLRYVPHDSDRADAGWRANAAGCEIFGGRTT
jgi:hypothetical protein